MTTGLLDMEEYRAPNCFRRRLHIAAHYSCPDCDFNESCPFGFNVNRRPAVNEIRIDFAGTASCNLDCRLCWAKTWNSTIESFTSSEISGRLETCLARLSSSMHRLSETGRVRKPEYFGFSDFQITGGEPLMNRARAEHVISVIHGLDDILQRNPDYLGLFKRRRTGAFAARARVRLFTNGIAIGKGVVGISELRELDGLRSIHVDLMVSLKGTNMAEFEHLQGQGWSPRHGTHEHQIEALSVLKKVEETIGCKYLSVNLVLGMYHSSSYDILCSGCADTPAFSDWSDGLKRIVRDYFLDGRSMFVEPVKNPYSGRSKADEAQWECEVKGLVRAPGTFEPRLKKGRGRTIAATDIAYAAFTRVAGGAGND